MCLKFHRKVNQIKTKEIFNLIHTYLFNQISNLKHIYDSKHIVIVNCCSNVKTQNTGHKVIIINSLAFQSIISPESDKCCSWVLISLSTYTSSDTLADLSIGQAINPHSIHQAVVAEWLRRLTRNQLGSARAGSNPADCEFFLVDRN